MARDLSFWKYKANVAAEDEAVYHELTSGARVEGVEELPIKAVVAFCRLYYFMPICRETTVIR